MVGSQGTTVAVLLAVTVVVTPLLASTSALPGLTQLLPGVAINQAQPGALGPLDGVSPVMTGAAIAAVLAGWAAASVAAGIWRTATREA
jgi:hypothetical protein